MIRLIEQILYPQTCVLCGKVLANGHIDLCPDCRETGPEFIISKKRLSHIAHWTALWYYKGNARTSIIKYKFRNQRSYSKAYGRLLAIRLQQDNLTDFDFVTWIPVSFRRKLTRGFDQVQKIGVTVSQELNLPLVSTLKKVIHNKPQSSLEGTAQRKANTLGAYTGPHPELVAGKRILLLDDIVTTGATASEAARTLLIAGAKEITFAAVAASQEYRINR